MTTATYLGPRPPDHHDFARTFSAWSSAKCINYDGCRGCTGGSQEAFKHEVLDKDEVLQCPGYRPKGRKV